jgi:putative intracellular protease/amidase
LGDPEALVAALRADIAAATGCTASAGIGPNLLLARLATRRAKPNGQLRVAAEQARPRARRGRTRGARPGGEVAHHASLLHGRPATCRQPGGRAAAGPGGHWPGAP